MSDEDFEHFARRAEEERRAAERASDPRAAQIHADLAQRYEAIAVLGGASKVATQVH